jgi:hypothetical protein
LIAKIFVSLLNLCFLPIKKNPLSVNIYNFNYL